MKYIVQDKNSTYYNTINKIIQNRKNEIFAFFNSEEKELPFNIYVYDSIESLVKGLRMRGFDKDPDYMCACHKNEDNSYRCTFKPDIKYANLTEVFCDNSNKISTENDSNKLFIYRYMKAREEEEYKKNRLLGDLSRNAKLNWEKKRIKRSISQKDSICIRQTLHNELLTAQNDNNDNDTE